MRIEMSSNKVLGDFSIALLALLMAATSARADNAAFRFDRVRAWR